LPDDGGAVADPNHTLLRAEHHPLRDLTQHVRDGLAALRVEGGHVHAVADGGVIGQFGEDEPVGGVADEDGPRS
jgi:hypothetical protein